MAHDVFISYSSKDKPIADGVCANLEAAGLRCWIAPRDIGPGDDFPTALANAIAASQVMVLVFSANSNSSEEVSRELFLAASSKVVIIPFKIEDVKPEPGKQYYLGRTHWLDAMNPPTQAQINQLVKRVHSFIKSADAGAQVAPGLSTEMLSDFKQPVHRKPVWFIPGVALFVVTALIIVGIIILPKLRGASQPTPTQAPSLTASLLPPGQPTLSSLSQNRNAPTLAGNSSIYLYREDFNDAQFDSIIPPNVEPDPNKCSNLKILQANGSLTFDAPAKTNLKCFVNLNLPYQMILSDIKAVEFALSTSPETPLNYPSFEFMLGGEDNNQKSLYLFCGLNANRVHCIVKKEQQDIYTYAYNTKDIIGAKPGDKFKFRIEVLDPDKMVFRFLVNGETIGEFTMPPADVPAYKDLFYHVGGGPFGMSSPTKADVFFMDYLAIEQR
jgi:hypothetical protein